MRTHLLFLEEGRLGNQLFQYFGLKKLRIPGEIIHLLGFSSLRASFGLPRDAALRIHPSRSRRLTRRLRHLSLDPRSLDMEARWSRSGFVDEAAPPRALLRVIRQAFFQRPEVLEIGATSDISFKSEIEAEARSELSRVGIDGPFGFVHVRTGDYASWPSIDAPALLPIEWYEEGVERIRSSDGELRIVVMGDSTSDSRRVAERLGAIHIHATEGVDMCVMSHAEAGVLSASTFALWGANMARARRVDQGLWIAPKLWGGVRLGRWYPEALQVDWLTYTDVERFL